MKDNLTCAIIDDEELDRLAVELELAAYSNVKILGSFNNPIDAIGVINNHKPDVLFLDIDMPGINGIDFIKSISDLDTINIFITSHPEFALQGFQLKIFDFILKPLETLRFKDCMNRIADFVQLKGKAAAYDVLFEHDKIIFKEGHNVVNLSVNDIFYLEAFGDYTKIVTSKKEYLTLITLSNFLKSLPIGKFIRIHRSFVSSINKIDGFGVKTININNQTLPIGKTFLKDVRLIFK